MDSDICSAERALVSISVLWMVSVNLHITFSTTEETEVTEGNGIRYFKEKVGYLFLELF